MVTTAVRAGVVIAIPARPTQHSHSHSHSQHRSSSSVEIRGVGNNSSQIVDIMEDGDIAAAVKLYK